MKIAIDQPNYIPWKGYFDLIHDVDLFIFYNDVQYTTRDWRNRNIIITPNGEKWLTIPVGKNTHRLICDVKMENDSWQKNHYEIIKFSYGKAPYFKLYKDFFENCYLGKKWEYLYELDQYLTIEIARRFLGIKTQFADSRDFETHGVKHERLLSLIENMGYQYMNLATQQRIILFQKIIRQGGLDFAGRVMRIIRSILSPESISIIMFLSWICCLTLARMHHIIYGDGEREREKSPLYIESINKKNESLFYAAEVAA